MAKRNYSSRRDFLKMSAMASGAVVAFNPYATSGSSSDAVKSADKLPREAWVAAIGLSGLQAKTPQLMAEKVLNLLEDNVPHYKADIVCLPEFFLFSSPVEKKNMSIEKKVDISLGVLNQFSSYARQNNCSVICPVFTRENGIVYNAAVVFDRKGSKLGDYKKIHLTVEEIEWGVTPGPLDPPVFQTDFGKIGIQTCYDIMWEDGWTKLSKKGAEVVFWPSGYAAGQTVNGKAWQHRYHVVSSSWKDTSKICDLTGKTICQTGRWQKNFICASVNLEKAFLHTWPSYKRFNEIEKKYGRRIKITTFHEEEWSIIESLSPDVFVADILKEFNLRTFNQELQEAETAQIRAARKPGR